MQSEWGLGASLSGYATPVGPSPVKQQAQGPPSPAPSPRPRPMPRFATPPPLPPVPLPLPSLLSLSSLLLKGRQWQDELAERSYWASAQLLSHGISPAAFFDVFGDAAALDTYARYYRSAATGVAPAYMMEGPACVWAKELPPRCYKSQPVYSCKVFVGGVPWDISEEALLEGFAAFGLCRVEWPGKEARYARSPPKLAPRHKGSTFLSSSFLL